MVGVSREMTGRPIRGLEDDGLIAEAVARSRSSTMSGCAASLAGKRSVATTTWTSAGPPGASRCPTDSHHSSTPCCPGRNLFLG